MNPPDPPPPAVARYLEIAFDCLPLRAIARRDIPIDASPKYRAFCERLLAALDKHGAFNTYYLHRGRCIFRLLNDPLEGMLTFDFEGTVLTDPSDTKTTAADLTVTLAQETCDWLIQPVVEWFELTTRRAVQLEFDHYIAAGDLARTLARLREQQAKLDESGGFVGMGL